MTFNNNYRSLSKKIYANAKKISQNNKQMTLSYQSSQKMMKIHCYHTNLSKISKFKRLGTIHQIISKIFAEML